MTAGLIKGITLGLLLSISVGPVIFAVIKQSLNNGHKGGYSFIAGVSASDLSLVLLCNGFSRLFDTLMEHETIIGIAGSCLLIGMGIYNIFFRKVAVADDGSLMVKELGKKDLAAIFFSGYFMNTFNPGAFLFWFAASATIIADSKIQEDPSQYRIVVFLTCLIFILCADISKVLLANKIREKLTPHNIHIINRISGIILIVFGIAISAGLLIRAGMIHF